MVAPSEGNLIRVAPIITIYSRLRVVAGRLGTKRGDVKVVGLIRGSYKLLTIVPEY